MGGSQRLSPAQLALVLATLAHESWPAAEPVMIEAAPVDLPAALAAPAAPSRRERRRFEAIERKTARRRARRCASL